MRNEYYHLSFSPPDFGNRDGTFSAIHFSISRRRSRKLRKQARIISAAVGSVQRRADQGKEKCNPGGIIRQPGKEKDGMEGGRQQKEGQSRKRPRRGKKAIEREKGRIGNVTTFVRGK